jgi:hypothetical protein
MTKKKLARTGTKDVNGMLDKALEDTFPASDPFSVGHSTSTEPPTRPTSRRPRTIDTKRVEQLAKKLADQRQK